MNLILFLLIVLPVTAQTEPLVSNRPPAVSQHPSISSESGVRGCHVLSMPSSTSLLTLHTAMGSVNGQIKSASGWFQGSGERSEVMISIPPGGIVVNQGSLHPMMTSLLNTVAGRPASFRSKRVSFRRGDEYLVDGNIYFAGRNYPASFPVQLARAGLETTDVKAKISSDNLQNVVGIDATGTADLKFRFMKGASSSCVN